MHVRIQEKKIEYEIDARQKGRKDRKMYTKSQLNI